MDFLTKLPDGHSLKPERPTAAHSLGGVTPVVAVDINDFSKGRSNNNYHYESQPQLPAQNFIQPESPWQTSN